MIRREGRVFLSENARSDKKIAISRRRGARSDEKIASCRRRTRTPTRRWRFLVGECVLRREGYVFLSEDACFDEKAAFSRRRTRASTRRLHFLVEGRALRQEDGVFSSEDAHSDEKVAFSRRRTRTPTRRLELLVDGRFLGTHGRPVRHPKCALRPAGRAVNGLIPTPATLGRSP